MAELSFDLSNVDDSRQQWVNSVGTFMVVIEQVDDSFTKAPNAILVDMKVTGGDNVGEQMDRIHRERLYCTERAMGRIACFAEAAGLATHEELQGAAVTLDLTKAVGRSLVVDIIADEYTDTKTGEKRTSYKCDYSGFYPLPSVKSTPAAPSASAPYSGL